MDVSEGTLLSTLEGHTSGINAVCYSSNGQILAAGADNDELRFWDAVTGETMGKLADFTPQQLESSLVEKAAELVPDLLGNVMDEGKAHASAVLCLTLSPDRQLVASGSQGSDIKVWTKDGIERAKLVGHSGRITRLIFHPDGHLPASASIDSTVILWNVSTGIVLYTLRGHTDVVQDIQFSSDVRLLASCSADKTIRLWDTLSGAATDPLEGHADTVTSMAFSPDGCVLASCSADTTVRLWNVKTAKSVASPLRGHADTVNFVTFSAGGDLVAPCSTDATVRLWPTEGTARGTIRGHTQGVNSVAFSPDGKLLVSSSDDHTVRFWDCEMKAERAKVDVAVVVRDVGFSTGRYIETDRGALMASSPVLGISSLSLGGVCTSFVTEDWVTKEKENALWLPEEYRATSVATHGGFTVLGHSSGSISLILLQ